VQAHPLEQIQPAATAGAEGCEAKGERQEALPPSFLRPASPSRHFLYADLVLAHFTDGFH
jgi:hypothetical protein